MDWNLFTFQDILDREQKKAKIKTYTDKEYREYVVANFKQPYTNNVFFNILLEKEFSVGDYFKSTLEPKEQLEHFTKLYNTLTYHFQNDYITLFSYKSEYSNSETEYHLFAAVKDDYIIEFPSVKDLFNGNQCMPACAINWYNADGKRVCGDYLKFKDNEKEIWEKFIEQEKEIIPPVDPDDKKSKNLEWWKDRREYYAFYKLRVHKYGKPCRVFEKHKCDYFSDYTFTLKNMVYYYSEVE